MIMNKKHLKYSILAVIITLTLSVSSCEKSEPEVLNNAVITREMADEVSADSLENYVSWLQQMGTRFALADNRRTVAVSIQNKFRSLGYDSVVIDSFFLVRTYKGTEYRQYQYNVIATLPASTGSDSVCIIGGHYDNITTTGDPFTTAPGANDNASGVAAALEVARVMKLKNFEPENTVKFVAFGAEELGLHGSKAYASDARSTLQRIMLMLNNDMIAYEPDNDKTKWGVNVIHYANSTSDKSLAYKLCREYTLLNPYSDNTYSNASDSYPFYTYGYKALFFFSKKMDPMYHTVSDVTGNCNFEYCSEIVKLNLAILAYRN